MYIVRKAKKIFRELAKLPQFPGKIKRAFWAVRRIGPLVETLHNAEAKIAHLAVLADQFRSEIEAVKGSLHVPPELIDDFANWKAANPIPQDPLVSVCVATYNRPELLVNRCLKSILNQTYKNLEVWVIGDGCAHPTERALKKIDDPRLHFFNLPERGQYPQDPYRRWMVAGSPAMNEGLRRARGDYITHLDDDDEFMENRIELLVQFAAASKADFIWHPFWYENDTSWSIHQCVQLFCGSVTTSSIFYRSWFKRIEWDVEAHLLDEPGDWNRIRRIKYLRPQMARCPEPLLRHYRERCQKAA